MSTSRRLLLLCTLLSLWSTQVHADSPLNGTWEVLPGQSTDIDHFRSLALTIRTAGESVTVVQTWRARVSIVDSLTVVPGGPEISVPVIHWVNAPNVYMGLRMNEGEVRHVSARWERRDSILIISERVRLHGSQGPADVTVTHRYVLREPPDILSYRLGRTSRTSGPALEYLFKRENARHAFVARIGNDFTIGGGLPVTSMMISLQGLANRTAPRVYLRYPADWTFGYVDSVLAFYTAKRFYTFTELKTPADAMSELARYARGYVVWDTNVRTSLIVAFTVAGLQDAVVVSEGLIPLVEKAGLKPLEDLRGRFTGMNDAQIYSWAYEQYWPRCSREFIIWMGGEGGTVMKPGVADWGIRQRVFFNDLSTKQSDSAEYALANTLLADMKPMSMVMGWHSYQKDLEEDHVALSSRYGHRVEGLHSLPNASFSAQVPLTPGFTFRNNHNVKPGEKLVPKQKVYISCIQTDGMGIGGWFRPGRGEIPYGWECGVNWTWLAPSMAEYFYTNATPNDYMIGGLSGPGYLYPKPVPRPLLTNLIAMAREQMKTLDLRVFETMDWSEGSEVEGNTDLPRDIIDMYYQGMPGAIGFVNGYGAGYTFDCRDGRPFVSFDYYLSPHRPEADAVADLMELATVNTDRPYFLLIHVREYSDVSRVKNILEKLGPEFENVPLDVFLTMAGSHPTFRERTLR